MNKVSKLLTFVTLASASAAVQATPMLVTNWTFTNEAGFIAYTDDDPLDGINNDIAVSGNSDGTSLLSDDSILMGGEVPTELCWGAPASGFGQSCMEVNSPVTENTTQSWDANGDLQDLNGGAAQGNAQTVAIGGDYTTAFKQGTALRHANYPITGDFLDTMTLVDGLELAYDDPVMGSDKAPELQFLVDFWETPNGGTCPYGTNGVGVNVNGCADVFEVQGFDATSVIAQGADFIDFAVNIHLGGLPAGWHKTYQVITRLSGLEVITQDQNNNPIYGFLTPERQVNVLNAQFAIRAIPEPSTIAILGLGLIGIGAAARRKAKA